MVTDAAAAVAGSVSTRGAHLAGALRRMQGPPQEIAAIFRDRNLAPLVDVPALLAEA